MKGIELYRRELPKSRQEFVQTHPHPLVPEAFYSVVNLVG